jgi:hypothetical protein
VKADPAKPEAAPVATPTAPAAPALVRRARAENLLGPGSLVAFDDEYDPELWAAKHVVDPAARNGWCSAPWAHFPHRLVIELPKTSDVARLAFDDACPEEKGFEGAAAREVGIEGSGAGPDGPWVDLGRVVLEKGKNDQPVDLPPNQVRWLRLAVCSNHGHPVLTQLLRVRAFAAEVVTENPGAGPPPATTDEGPFRLERVKLSLEKNGAALDPPALEAGQALWIYFKPRALQLTAAGEFSLEVDLTTTDAHGEVKHSLLKVVDHKGKPPAPPLSTYVTLKVELDPDTYKPGLYTLRIVARDREAKKETSEKIAFEVKKPR